MKENERMLLHLKLELGDSECSKCKADISENGFYTYKENVYNEPPPGYRNCRAMWAE